MPFSPKLRRVASALLTGWVLGAYLLSVFGFARPALAEEAPSSLPAGIVQTATAGCRGANTAFSPDPCEGANEAANQVDSKIVKPTMQVALITALLNLATFVFDRLAYEAAVWVATGGEGETPLFNTKNAEDAWKDFGLQIVGDAMGELQEATLDQLNIDFDICAPTNPLINASISLGLKQSYKPQQPKCKFQDIYKNWDAFLASTASDLNPSQSVLKAFAQGLKPGQNELSATIGLNLAVHQQVLEAKQTNLLEQVNSGGFKAVVDQVTGKVETPASVLQSELTRTIGNAQEEPTRAQLNAALENADLLGNMFLHVAGTFTNTLLSTLMNKVYTGLFDVQPDTDPLEGEIAAISSREDAANRFASLITVSPTQVENYNVLAEFLACPMGGIAVRNLNNCVLDSGFASAIARAESGTPMTVQEAIDQNLIHGDWPLIPHELDNVTKNQDPLCYTYGYCYGNLVKMRKARVLPIGWEIAASRNSGSVTLQEIVDGFDDCGDQAGGIDDSHQWCHLVDPNWVLKYPETQCRALANGELLLSTLSPGRAGACVDTPSCISENNDGSCDGGYGYCVQESNVWRFRGEECPAQYASCMAFENTDSGDSANYLLNTVEYSVCDASNAGCEWYRTNKYYDDGGTVDDTSDDAYEWLPGTEADDGGFVTADREDDARVYDRGVGNAPRAAYTYATTGGTTVLGYDSDGDGVDDASYGTYAYQDRVYFNNNVEECASEDAGCSAVYAVNDTLALNLVRNPSFETDDDEDGVPDDWGGYLTLSTGTLDTSGDSYYGTSAHSTGAVGVIQQEGIRLAPNNFYTLSFYARQSDDSASDAVSARVVLRDDDGAYVDLGGTSVSDDCAVDDWELGADNSVLLGGLEPEDSGYESFGCTFTVPDVDNGVVADILFTTGDALVDAVQMQVGEDATSFADGYNSASPSTSYLLLPPDYLGCTGASTDPAECEDYVQMCTAQDVGCNLYTPEDGDPSVPAIASSLDECPSECVGYASFKQEATVREGESFPLYFIADRASACSSQYVGCDAFTNLDAVVDGGEGLESYTDLRACMTPEMAPGDDADNESSTYFTWEGSDAAGYQLVTWSLLESNQSDSASLTFSNLNDDGTYTDEDDIGLAPCVAWDVTSESTLVCAETSSTASDIEDNDACDEHDDIFDNPDCREFYDTAGNIHYRELPDTVAVDADCHPYRYSDSNETDCEASGGYWTDAGDCRYFGLAEESVECPAAQAGCRAYTGGAGRNATTVFSDDVEDGSVSEYGENAGAAISVSNESVATGGHSLRVSMSATSSITTAMQYLDWSDRSLTYDADDSADTCSGIDASHAVTGSGCEIDYGTGNPCTVGEGDNTCGTLDDALVNGKTYMLSFWAKGSGPITVTFVDEGGAGDTHDFVDPNDGEGDNDELALDGGWLAYALGPLDTSDFADFDDAAVISFGALSGTVFYLDNIQLKAVEENVAVIKDSWVVPSTCDLTPDGADAPQYYLGCEAYVDQNGDDANLYQFSDLCSEEVVGCEAVYDTQNSDDAFGEIRNARCTWVSNDPTDDDTVSTNTDCEIEEETVCTISAGESYCLFDQSGAVPAPMPYTVVSGLGIYYMELGPEARVVSDDAPMYVVDDGSASCAAESAGCEEVGMPTYNQDKTEVTGFTSAYVLNDPDDYDDILCDDEALFCEEWTSTQDGNFYFKDPMDQTCEYRSNVTVDGVQYYGWFRTSTDEPCYDDYVIGGSQYGVWRNGDDAFTGWGATCAASYDLCTEFTDLSDTSEGSYPAGTPYYFVDDDGLSEEALTASEQCQGQVSQKEGCALFNDATDSEIRYNTSASYVASTHADALFGDAPGSKQDPVSCEGGGEDIELSDGTTVNLCAQRCAYRVVSGDSIDTPDAEFDTASMNVYSTETGLGSAPYFERSCYEDADCPDILTTEGNTATGTCERAVGDAGLTDVTFALEDDANRVVKVYRDRECAAWLSCQSSQVSWNSRTNKYETICDRVGLCTEYTRTGDSSFCTAWADTDPVVLSASEYADRNVTWNGVEYSGYAIPDQLPVDQYDQVNVAPEATGFICVLGDESVMVTPVVPELLTNGNFVSCDDVSDSASCSTGYVCRQVEEDFRLGYVAGACDQASSGWFGSCVVGTCEESGDGCSGDGDCSSGEECVVGYCQDVSATSCLSNADADADGVADACAGDPSRPVCDTIIAKCVDVLAGEGGSCVTSSDCSGTGTPTCTPTALAKTGSCVNNLCATGIDGGALVEGDGEEQSCRGYPEALSPFPTDVVTSWNDPDGGDPAPAPADFDSQPYSFRYGFESQESCAPIAEDIDGDEILDVVATNDCVCSYDKVQYGDGGAVTRYYPPGTTLSELSAQNGVCLGGDLAGKFCSTDDQCSSSGTYGGAGTCAQLARTDTVYGWTGYCLERDTSIQLNGSSSQDDRACLTWLPVDQLSGSTDLYGKYLNAGYNGGDTYYCGEQRAAYVLKAQEQTASVTSCDPTTASFICDDGTFGVVDTDSCDESASDPSYTYTCIPSFSFVGGDTEESCEVPEDGTEGDDSIDGASMYYLSASDYLSYLDEGSDGRGDCQTPALMRIGDVLDFLKVSSSATSSTVSESATGLQIESYMACTDVVKVSSSSLSEWNKAWTDRLFAQTAYAIQGIGSSYDSIFGYELDTDQSPFGMANDREAGAGINTTTGQYLYPLSTFVCESESANPMQFPGSDDGSCVDSAYSALNASTQEARAYGYAEFDYYVDQDSAHADAWSSGTGCDALAETEIASESNDYGTSYLYSGEGCNCETWVNDDPSQGCETQASCGSDNRCSGGINDGLRCEADVDCRPLYCYYAINDVGTTTGCTSLLPIVRHDELGDTAGERIRQIFAGSLAWYGFDLDTSSIAPDSAYNGTGEYDDLGVYQELTELPDAYAFDVTSTGDSYLGTSTPTPPIVVSVGDCDGTDCYEGSEGKFNVNGLDEGTIEGSDGYKHVSVSFFAYADANQMPVKNILVDWGDDGSDLEDGAPWDTGSQSGSTSDDNFYRNHRGIDPGTDDSACSSDDWGTSSSACEQSYVTFVHDYTCMDGDLDDLPECEVTVDPNGQSRLVAAPCTSGDVPGASGACVFQPRVSVKDNWGWCTGYCDSQDDSADVDTTSDTAGWCYADECDTSHCPSEGEDGSCPDSETSDVTTDNPWINFDGYVIVTP